MPYRYPRGVALQIVRRDQTSVGTNKPKTTGPLSAAEGQVVNKVYVGNSSNAYTESLDPCIIFSKLCWGAKRHKWRKNKKGWRKILDRIFHCYLLILHTVSITVCLTSCKLYS